MDQAQTGTDSMSVKMTQYVTGNTTPSDFGKLEWG
jgi:hypothetical protein